MDLCDQFYRKVMFITLSLLIINCLLWHQANGQSTGDLRLVTSFGTTGGTSGRLEIYYNSVWGTVCDDSFGSIDATVACRQLGYTGASSYGSVGSLGFSQAFSSTPTWLDEVSCFGTESRLASCSHNGYGNEDCSHSEDVALVCSSSSGPLNGDLRLVSSFGSTGGSSGRLEIYYSSQWGTVCDDSFGSTDANVACRQLGYNRASDYGSVGSLGYSQAASSARTWLDEVSCLGTESRLASCSHNGYGIEDCFHSEDIALVCTNSATGVGTATNVINVAVGVSVGGVILIFIAVFSCVFCCIACIARSSRSTRTVRVAQPTMTPGLVSYTTTQQTAAYPLEQSYSAAPQQLPAAYPAAPQQPPAAYPAAPQQPPAAYPAAQIDSTKEPANPEFSSQAPPPYNFPTQANAAYQPADLNTSYPPADPNAGYPLTNSNAGYPPADSNTGYPLANINAGYPPADPNAGYPPTDFNASADSNSGYPLTNPSTGYPPAGDPNSGYIPSPNGGEQYPPQP